MQEKLNQILNKLKIVGKRGYSLKYEKWNNSLIDNITILSNFSSSLDYNYF
ncbi:unnamed protein product [Brugia timori]|uniref:DpnII domain-containing protein n=1 Tax=Brugia timori TaxID=42155 RepID=A0A0R3QN14_9BILA|nr:unnamed protein product [Brugia timori]